MGNRISLTESARQISQLYQTLASTNVHAMELFYENVTNLCRQCGYKPMIDFANLVYDFYHGEFKSHMMNEFRNWEQSDYSLDALMRKINAGSAAEHTARGYMSEIREGVESLFHMKASSVTADTSTPSLDAKEIMQMNEFVRDFLNTSRSAKEQALGSIQSLAADNKLFDCIIGIVRSTADSFENCFTTMIGQVEKGADLFGQGVMQTVTAATADRGRAVEAHHYFDWCRGESFL